MIFRYEPRQTGRAGRVEISGGEFSRAAGAQSVPFDERVKKKLRAASSGAATDRLGGTYAIARSCRSESSIGRS
jgi:hypothetical protein